MDYSEQQLAPTLRSVVHCIWAFAGPRDSHRVLPDGCIDILVRDERAQVVGTMRRAVTVAGVPGAVLGVRLRPGEAARLLPAAPRELTDSGVALADLWGDDGRILEAALVAVLAAATHERLRAHEILGRADAIVEDAIRRRLAAHGETVDLRMRAAVGLLASGTCVREVAERVELSERQLGRRFGDRVGLAPKTFARVRRLQRAANALSAGIAPCEAATLVGYADQAHFTRDASEIAGITPSALRREVNDARNTTITVGL
ncbi:MAG: helix-turn-helix transcriptional regulator [Deltaproteobacteria bacterium]